MTPDAARPPFEDHVCGTWDYHQDRLRRDAAYRRRWQAGQQVARRYEADHPHAAFVANPRVIPVVVHVVWNTASQNLPLPAIQNQIAALNRDFSRSNADAWNTPGPFGPLVADTGIQFQLAVRDPNCQPTTGVTSTQTAVPSFDLFDNTVVSGVRVQDYVKYTSKGGIDAWPADRYLNIWVCRAVSAGQGGFATFPGSAPVIDGVVVNSVYFGPGSGWYLLGRTCVHEVGHYLDLWHPFEGSCGGTDNVVDTPQAQGANSGPPPTFPKMSCAGEANGDMFMNYMDYQRDAGRYMFTVGQALRMHAALAGARASLLASDALTLPPTLTTGPDLWSADTATDPGDEPDPLNAPMWESDDIWVRNQNDGLTMQEHENPVHRASGVPNYVYVRVRNRSCMAAGSGDVKLYWAKASTGLSWPSPWDGVPVSTSPVPIMGGLIGSQPTGSVPARGSVVLALPWQPPDPNDYTAFGGDMNHFCLLSRVETSPMAPFGMTFPETGSLFANVQNNNKIVWKNVHVVAGPRLGDAGHVTIGNLASQPRETFLSFTVIRARDSWGRAWTDLEIGLDQQLNTRLRAALRGSPAVTFLPQRRAVIRQLGVPLGPFVLASGEHHTVSVRLVPATGADLTGVYLVDVIQYGPNPDGPGLHVVGGQRVVFKVLRRPTPASR
jgi:hypothetical protein